MATDAWYEYSENGYSIGVGDWNKSRTGWLRSDRPDATASPDTRFSVIDKNMNIVAMSPNSTRE